jgi:hypothetical protein
MALALGACGDDNGTPDDGNGNNEPSHLGGTATANGTCDNPNDTPKSCYAYVGSTWSGTASAENCADLEGTFSSTQGCTSTGRGGRCTLFAGTANEFIAHCYDSTSTCQTNCENGGGTFTAN